MFFNKQFDLLTLWIHFFRLLLSPRSPRSCPSSNSAVWLKPTQVKRNKIDFHFLPRSLLASSLALQKSSLFPSNKCLINWAEGRNELSSTSGEEISLRRRAWAAALCLCRCERFFLFHFEPQPITFVNTPLARLYIAANTNIMFARNINICTITSKGRREIHCGYVTVCQWKRGERAFSSRTQPERSPSVLWAPQLVFEDGENHNLRLW